MSATVNVAMARRIQRSKEVWKEFSSNRAGFTGLCILAAVILLALLAPLLAPESTLDVTRITAPQNQPPTWANPLGTDPAGRSVLALLVWGARVSLLVGFSATAVSMVIGTIVGMAAGHFTGTAQAVLMRVIDFFLVVPGLVLAIVLSSVIGPGVATIIIAIGITSWAGTARLVRSQTLTVEARPYIERGWALGASDGHIITKHVLPAVMPLVLANTTLTVGSAVIAESTLSFLGLGDPGSISWGSMLKTALDTGAATGGYWWYVLTPGIAIVIVVLSFTLVGRAVESVINPTLRGR
jgi:peptide/nickel transport system permease protein